MTALSGALLTFDAIGQREDLSNAINDISPTDTPVMNAMGKKTAKAVTHEWQTDALATAAANNQLEGDTFTFAAPDVTTRLANTTQVSYKTVAVSGTLNAVDTAGRAKEMIYQSLKRAKEIKRDMEFVITNNQTPVPQASSSSSTARALRPILSWYSTNVDAGVGGASGSASTGRTDASAGNQRDLDENMLKQAVRNAWSAGGEPSTVVVDPFNKQRISGFAGNATRQIMASDKKLIAGIGYYEHDFGIVKIVPDRFSRERDAHVLDMGYWNMATLRPMKTESLAKTADADKGVVLTEWTIESGNEAASALIADLTTS